MTIEPVKLVAEQTDYPEPITWGGFKVRTQGISGRTSTGFAEPIHEGDTIYRAEVTWNEIGTDLERVVGWLLGILH